MLKNNQTAAKVNCLFEEIYTIIITTDTQLQHMMNDEYIKNI